MDAAATIEWAERCVFAALAVMSTRRWLQERRDDLRRVALTFVVLTVLSLGGLLSFGGPGPASELLRRVWIGLLAAFPWMLWRVAADLHAYGRRTTALVSGATVAMVLTTLVAMPGEGAPGVWGAAFVLCFVLEWLAVSATATVGLWRAGRHLPGVARLRVRTVALGTAMLTAAVVLLGIGPSVRALVPIVGLASGVIFYAGFSAPPLLRAFWRQRTREAFSLAERDLLTPLLSSEVAATILPHALRLTGSSAAMLTDEGARVWAVDGESQFAVGDVVEGLGLGPVGTPGGLHAVRLRTGWLAVRPVRGAPIFGRDELAELASLGYAVDMALERAADRTALRESERQLTEAQVVAGVGSFSWNPVTAESVWSPNIWRLLGYRPADVTDPYEAFMARVHPGDLAEVSGKWHRLQHTPAQDEHLFRAILPGAGVRWFHSRCHRVVEDGAGRLVGTIQDVTEQFAVDVELRSQAGRHASVASLSHDALSGRDPASLMASATRTAAELLGVEHVAVLQSTGVGDELVVGAALGLPGTRCGAVVAAPSARTLEGRCLYLGSPVTADRFVRPAVLELAADATALAVALPGRIRSHGVLAVYDPSGRTFGPSEIDFLRSVANVLAAAIERADAEQAMVRQAFQDDLTGLANRHRFAECLADALGEIGGSGRRLAVLFCDLDRFKVVNDGLGHSTGDRLLQAVATRFAGVLRTDDVLARFGGDEFVVLATDSDWETADVLARRLAASLDEPILIGSRAVRVTVSIGVVVVDGEADVESVLRDADVAMYRAKDRGRDRAERFDADLQGRIVERLELEAELQEAFGGGQLVLHYQPEIALADGRMIAMEALVRWQHPQRGLLPPDAFLSVAEDAGMMVELGEWVLEEVCRQAVAWRAAGAVADDVMTWVNLSAADLGDPTLPARVAATLARTGADPRWIGIEITERALMEELDSIVAVLDGLRALGVQLAIDDLGTGFSSLSYLKRFPVGFLKIDREFVSGLTSDAGDAAIVRAVIDLAHGLGLQAVAEGIETPEQLEALRALGCDIVQGYHLGRPVPAGQIARLALA